MTKLALQRTVRVAVTTVCLLYVFFPSLFLFEPRLRHTVGGDNNITIFTLTAYTVMEISNDDHNNPFRRSSVSTVDSPVIQAGTKPLNLILCPSFALG